MFGTVDGREGFPGGLRIQSHACLLAFSMLGSCGSDLLSLSSSFNRVLQLHVLDVLGASSVVSIARHLRGGTPYAWTYDPGRERLRLLMCRRRR